jgi:hypothetical protein
MGISRFNGLRSDHHVCAFVLSLLDSPDWATLNRERVLNKRAAATVSCFLEEYADKEGIYLKVNYVNRDDVHALMDLPTAFSFENVVQLPKRSSSH